MLVIGPREIFGFLQNTEGARHRVGPRPQPKRDGMLRVSFSYCAVSHFNAVTEWGGS